MKNKVILLGVATLLIGASAYADGDSDRQCRRTTSRCGTEAVKPSEGYEGQQCERDRERRRRHSRRCGGCGRDLPDAENKEGSN